MAAERQGVLVVCGDPGGARALLPVLLALRQEGRVTVAALAYRQARDILTAAGLAPAPLADGACDPAVAARELAARRPALLLLGTSVNGTDWEKAFVTAARDAGIPALAVLDFWSNYLPRFSTSSGRWDCLPDRVAVMDDRAARELVAAGAPADRLVVTGQPAFDDLAAQRDRFTATDRARVRAALRLGANERLVLFASQPVRQLVADGLPSPGYDEHEVIETVLAALPQLGSADAPVALVIRPHPREPLAWFVPAQGTGWRSFVARDADSRELALAADLVVGMNSVLLLEACCLGAVVVSLQPGLRGTDALPTNASGASEPVFARAAIGATLARMLNDSGARRERRASAAAALPPATATRQVADLAYAMIGCGPAAASPSS